MYQPHLHTTFTSATETATSPELRRMQLASRARREELDLLIYTSSQHGRRQTPRASTASSRAIDRTIHAIRDSIGGMLISAGNRIQSA